MLRYSGCVPIGVCVMLACSIDGRQPGTGLGNGSGTLCDARTTPCRTGEVCLAASGECAADCGGCTLAGICFTAGDTNPANACELCDPAVATAWSLAPPLTTCDDGLACTLGDHCVAGECEGSPMVCGALEDCDPSSGGCQPLAAAGGANNGGTGGSDPGGAGTGGSGGLDACDVTAFPASDPCVITEELGVFVAPTGDDSRGDGSRESPFASLTRAVDVARARDRRVYACASSGVFSELLRIDAALDGLELFGGFSCADWSYDVSLKAAVLSPFSTALEIEGLSLGVRFENFSFESSTASVAGTSSIAARLVSSTNVSFVSSSFTAGDGAVGVAGRAGERGEDGQSPVGPLAGADASCSANQIEDGPAGASNACGSVAGNGGGTVPPPNAFGFFGGQGAPGVQNGGVPSEVLGGSGGAGAPGAVGANGGSAFTSPRTGIFSALGYTPPLGPGGAAGGTGQGGGGGAAGNALDENDFCRQALGGAGGLGGCGGQGGGGGRGGGASVAVLSWNSQVTLRSCELVSGNGGNGGAGGDGGAAGTGEAGARGGFGSVIESDQLVDLSGDGGAGARGGNGGIGGGGAGAAGGPSVNIVFQGTTPARVSGTILVGSGGVGGPGGQGGDARALNGATGESLVIFNAT